MNRQGLMATNSRIVLMMLFQVKAVFTRKNILVPAAYPYNFFTARPIDSPIYDKTSQALVSISVVPA